MIGFFNWFTKITAWPIQKIIFRTKVYYEDKQKQSRKLKGPAIIISNHTAVYDYAVFLFVFFGRTLRYQMAELLFKKKVLGWYLKKMGGIEIDRNSYDMSHVAVSQEVLKRKGVVGIFPEGRIPEKEETRPLPFKEGAAYLALLADVPVIPIYTNGVYFKKDRARVIIGKPILPSELIDDNKTEKENIENITNIFRDKIIELGAKLGEQSKEK